MIITILTMFPEMFGSFLAAPIPRRAKDRGIAEIRLIDIKDYAGGSFRHIDDSTFGGGAGMVLRAEPVLKALQAAVPGREERPGTLIAALTPAGRLYDQKTAERYRKLGHLVLICGHYEGMDERIYSHVDERISIGDYILSGGETAAMTVMDSILRLLPGVLRKESTEGESFTPALNGLLEYPQYTRPAVLGDSSGGDRVPEVLLSGNHEAIRRWRLQKSLETTLLLRPDLLLAHPLTGEERSILLELAQTMTLTEEQRVTLRRVVS